METIQVNNNKESSNEKPKRNLNDTEAGYDEISSSVPFEKSIEPSPDKSPSKTSASASNIFDEIKNIK